MNTDPTQPQPITPETRQAHPAMSTEELAAKYAAETASAICTADSPQARCVRDILIAKLPAHFLRFAHALQAQQVTATDKARIIDIVDRVIGEFPHPVPYRLDLAALITSALSRVPQPEPGKDTERLNAMEEALSKVEGCDWESIIGHAYVVGIRKSVDAHLAASTKGTGEGRA
jgi:hypothetical protein